MSLRWRNILKAFYAPPPSLSSSFTSTSLGHIAIVVAGISGRGAITLEKSGVSQPLLGKMWLRRQQSKSEDLPMKRRQRSG